MRACDGFGFRGLQCGLLHWREACHDGLVLARFDQLVNIIRAARRHVGICADSDAGSHRWPRGIVCENATDSEYHNRRRCLQGFGCAGQLARAHVSCAAGLINSDGLMPSTRFMVRLTCGWVWPVWATNPAAPWRNTAGSAAAAIARVSHSGAAPAMSGLSKSAQSGSKNASTENRSRFVRSSRIVAWFSAISALVSRCRICGVWAQNSWPGRDLCRLPSASIKTGVQRQRHHKCLFAAPLQRVVVIWAHEDDRPFGQTAYPVRPVVPDGAVLHPEQLVKILCVQRLGARWRHQSTGDMHGRPAAQQVPVLKCNLCHNVKIAQVFGGALQLL